MPVSSARGRFPTSRGSSFLLRLSEGLPGLLAALLWRHVIFEGDARGPFLGVPKATLLIFSLERDRFPREAPAGELPPETGPAAPDTPGAEGRAACAVLAPWGQAPCVAPAMQVRGPHDSAAPQAASAHLDEPGLSLPGTGTRQTVPQWLSRWLRARRHLPVCLPASKRSLLLPSPPRLCPNVAPTGSRGLGRR